MLETWSVVKFIANSWWSWQQRSSQRVISLWAVWKDWQIVYVTVENPNSPIVKYVYCTIKFYFSLIFPISRICLENFNYSWPGDQFDRVKLSTSNPCMLRPITVRAMDVLGSLGPPVRCGCQRCHVWTQASPPSVWCSRASWCLASVCMRWLPLQLGHIFILIFEVYWCK